MNSRRQELLKLIAQETKLSVNQIAEHLEVSGVTVRQDLDYLQKEGFLKRVHGGVAIIDSDDISSITINYDKKLRIAKKASSFVQRGETILIEGGSTNTILAKEVSKRDGITIITPSVFIARECGKGRNNDVILLGGLYQRESESLIGSLTKLCIDTINLKKVFIGVDGFTIDTGFTSKDMMRAEIAAYMAKKSDEVFILTDSSKFGKIELTKLFDVDAIRCVITDDSIPKNDKYYLEGKGLAVIVV
jgi:DeoR/GlpR family transcriptional regulator of sugar metabolism